MGLITKRRLFLLTFLFIFNNVFAQKDSAKQKEPLKAIANIQITNNGISLFPNLSLGKPATIINIAVGKNHVFFEPELRWRLNGDPWSYIFWLRYRPQKTEHFSWHIGAHPSYIIRESPVSINGQATNRWIASRFLAVEVVPVWHLSPKFSVGLHVLASKGLDPYGVQKSTYISLQPRFPHIDLSRKFYLGFFPQVFHLTLDDNEGTYYSHMLSINKNNFPLYLSTVFTYKIKSTIAGDTFIWSFGLNCRF